MALQPIIDPELLRTFLAIADTGSFSAAADIVGRTPSAVSMQIKKLEEIVDRRLFNRDSRSVVLTAQGEALVGDARRIVELNVELVARMRTPDLAGSITVGTPDEYAGSVIGDLNSRRGQVQGTEMRGNATVVNAMVPLANMFGYVNTLRSMSQGRAQYTMQFDHYAQVPSQVAQEIQSKYA